MRLVEKILPPYWVGHFKPNGRLRPFFGWIGRHANGPGNRTKHMIEAFGNYYINPNLAYAQSSWSMEHLESTVTRAVRRNVPIVMNQNGWYYPAWYPGDWKLANKQLLQAHQRSNRVIFQSHFCVEAMSALTGVMPHQPVVLHNAVNVPTGNFTVRNPSRPILWLSGAFHRDADHILLPALEAIEILSQEMKEDSPLLKIAGYFDQGALKSEWYGKVQSKLISLVSRRRCLWLGKYAASELPGLIEDVSLGLHLTSKDSCPNAVLERMALGVGHIYAKSGGTPELIGEAGIGVNSPLDWNRQTPVNVDELVEAMKLGLGCWRILGSNSLNRVKEKFSWDKYINAHKKIFLEVSS